MKNPMLMRRLSEKGLIVFTVASIGMIAFSAYAVDKLPDHQEWNFVVTLDGAPFGSHQFTLDRNTSEKDQLQITSEANFVSSLIGIPVFRYHHGAHEEWSGSCLSQLTSDTNHDGDKIYVTAKAASDGGTVQIVKGSSKDAYRQATWTGCLMTFAYWNPDMRQQTHLLDPETGEIEPVAITQQPDTTIMVHGHPTTGHVWRITGIHNPVDVVYDDNDNWIGLDAQVRGGRALSYRLP